MQVTVEAGEGLVRKLVVEVPSEIIEFEVENRLQSMKSQVKIDGFRPGKIPLKVVKQRYGKQVLFEVAGEMIQKTFQDALTQENLKPAGEPEIKDEVIKSGEPLQYTAEFEIYPEITLAPVADLKVQRTVSSVTDADVDNMIETLRKQHTDWEPADRVSQDGDRMIINFVGTAGGEVFDGGTADNVPLVLGSGSMIPGF
jgi:trigger factor